MNDQRYDVIVSEPSNPWMTVASNLFTREFFDIGRRRLKPGGVFAQWLQLYGMSPDDLKALMRTFHAAFPHVLVFNTIEDADLILVGSEQPLTFDLDDLARRMSVLDVNVDLRRVHVKTPEVLLTYFILGTKEVESFTGKGPLNTDDNALIEFQAPMSLHYETRGVNVALLRQATTHSGAYAPALTDESQQRRHALAMAEAFERRPMWSRARDAVNALPGLAEFSRWPGGAGTHRGSAPC